MPRELIPSSFYALAVVRKGDRFLLIHEVKFDQTWFLPAGRVEPGETWIDGIQREAIEEGGLPIVLDGLLRIEHTLMPNNGVRLRIFFLAHPADERPPKSQPDGESLEAAWVSLDELERYPLRTEDVRELLEYVSKGGPVYPLSLLTQGDSSYEIQ